MGLTIWKQALMVAAILSVSAPADATVLSGNLGDPTNPALVYNDLGAPSSTDIVNNVAIYSLAVPVTQLVTIQSTGYGAGGADPYFTLFQGAGLTATFYASNYDQAFATGGDFLYAGLLTAGQYQIALGVFANMSFAENWGAGTLADGFIGLGDPGSLGTGDYALTVTYSVPEPATWAMLILGFAGLGVMAYRQRPKPAVMAA